MHLKSTQGRLLLVFLSLVLVACTGVKDQKNEAGKKVALRVEGFKIIPQPFNDKVITTADLLPNEQVTIMSPIAGQVLEIHFKEGTRVKKGDRIIRIYDKNWKAELIGLSAELDMNHKDLERKKSLLDVGGSTQEEIDQAFSAAELLKSKIQQLQLNIDLANVKAPFSGILGMRDFSEGAYLQEGEKITTLIELEQLKVNFTLPQEYLSSLKVNTKVDLLVRKDTLEATVYAVNPLVDATSRTINVRALLRQPKDKKIIPGTYAEVLVSKNYIEDAVLVPTQSVVPEINDQTVYVYRTGKAVRKTIQLGIRTEDMVHVLSGITAGDTIITSGLLQVKEGMDVELQSVK